MKITIARLRSGVNYKRPLDHIIDSFCELYKKFIINHSEYSYGYYNFGFNKPNRRKLDDIIDSDVIIIPSENEFISHIDKYLNPRLKSKTFEAVDKIIPYLKDKHIIILRSDRADTEELYRTRTFKNQLIGKFSIIDELDIPFGIHAMKYHFIQERVHTQLFKPEKEYDFAYWGCDKKKLIDNTISGDNRHIVLRQIQKDKKLKSFFIGRYATVKRDMKIDTMRNILPFLEKSKYTMCFNWLDPKATTSRYHESLACGIIPMIWQDTYDVDNILVKDDWQRVNTVEELYDKIDFTNYDKKYKEIHDTYKKTVLSKDEIYSNFELLLLNKLK
tara:strand:+ start:502 stop:1494 length:993 start_codon:yes stop_codon:yes gene_type:complete